MISPSPHICACAYKMCKLWNCDCLNTHTHWTKVTIVATSKPDPYIICCRCSFIVKNAKTANLTIERKASFVWFLPLASRRGPAGVSSSGQKVLWNSPPATCPDIDTKCREDPIEKRFCLLEYRISAKLHNGYCADHLFWSFTNVDFSLGDDFWEVSCQS